MSFRKRILEGFFPLATSLFATQLTPDAFSVPQTLPNVQENSQISTTLNNELFLQSSYDVSPFSASGDQFKEATMMTLGLDDVTTVDAFDTERMTRLTNDFSGSTPEKPYLLWFNVTLAPSNNEYWTRCGQEFYISFGMFNSTNGTVYHVGWAFTFGVPDAFDSVGTGARPFSFGSFVTPVDTLFPCCSDDATPTAACDTNLITRWEQHYDRNVLLRDGVSDAIYFQFWIDFREGRIRTASGAYTYKYVFYTGKWQYRRQDVAATNPRDLHLLFDKTDMVTPPTLYFWTRQSSLWLHQFNISTGISADTLPAHRPTASPTPMPTPSPTQTPTPAPTVPAMSTPHMSTLPVSTTTSSTDDTTMSQDTLVTRTTNAPLDTNATINETSEMTTNDGADIRHAEHNELQRDAFAIAFGVLLCVLCSVAGAFAWHTRRQQQLRNATKTASDSGQEVVTTNSALEEVSLDSPGRYNDADHRQQHTQYGQFPAQQRSNNPSVVASEYDRVDNRKHNRNAQGEFIGYGVFPPPAPRQVTRDEPAAYNETSLYVSS